MVLDAATLLILPNNIIIIIIINNESLFVPVCDTEQDPHVVSSEIDNNNLVSNSLYCPLTPEFVVRFLINRPLFNAKDFITTVLTAHDVVV